MHSSAVGADGKIYFGGFGVRSYTGGGLGWYDPQTGKIDCLWKPFSGYAVYWIAPVLNGRLIAISTRTAADELKGNQAPETVFSTVWTWLQVKCCSARCSLHAFLPMLIGRTG